MPSLERSTIVSIATPFVREQRKRMGMRVWPTLVAAFIMTLSCQVEAQGPAADAPANKDPLKVLFLGNSYTSYNNLPAVVAAFAAADGTARPMRTVDVSQDGASLIELANFGRSKDAIAAGKWDFAVLQEQSMLPISNPSRMHQGAGAIDEQVKKVGAKTILFLTWARRGNPETQESLNRAYTEVAKELGARVAPVGPAWAAALAIDPTIKLHTRDGSHPTITGTYLSACVIYLVIQGGPRCPSMEMAGVLPRYAALARKVAEQTVFTGHSENTK